MLVLKTHLQKNHTQFDDKGQLAVYRKFSLDLKIYQNVRCGECIEVTVVLLSLNKQLVN